EHHTVMTRQQKKLIRYKQRRVIRRTAGEYEVDETRSVITKACFTDTQTVGSRESDAL
ncbi:6124_t:CDS:1, partial [Paraglomus occultum]